MIDVKPEIYMKSLYRFIDRETLEDLSCATESVITIGNCSVSLPGGGTNVLQKGNLACSQKSPTTCSGLGT